MSWFSSKKKKDPHTGFIGDMSDTQHDVLDEFKRRIQEEGLTNDPRYDDYYLLRFCRARKFEIEKVMKMFKDFLEWRVKYQADDALCVYKCPNIPEIKKIYHHGYHATTKGGHPFYIDRCCMFGIDELLGKIDKEELYTYHVKEYEKLIHQKFPACSKASNTKIEQGFSVLDAKGFSMGKLSKKSRDVIQIAISIGQDNYPEIMYKMLIINAPMMFRGAWSVISPFIDKKTRDKITILGSKYHDTLLEIVDKENVPESLGGDCTCAAFEGG